jgi:hypothetical protein
MNEPKERYNQQVDLIEKYIRSLNGFDEALYFSLFTEDCVVNDPYGTSEYLGTEGLKRFMKTMKDTWEFFEMRADSFYPGDGNRMAVRWSVSATAKSGKKVEFSGVNIFYFVGDKISGLDGYWHFRGLMKQLRD